MRRLRLGARQAAGLALVWLALAAHPGAVRAQSIEEQVDAILAMAQSHSGQIVSELARLGPAAVPTLLARLDTYRFPMAIVQALGRIGDDRATQRLINLLNDNEPFASTRGERHAQRRIIIAALKEISDSRAESLLNSILSNPNVFDGTRLAAAGALARLGSPGTKAQARAFILEAERESRGGRYARIYTSGPFSPIELVEALFEVNTPESEAILVDRLLRSGLPAEELAIIGLLAQRPSPAGAAALLELAERVDREAYIRLQAAKALVEMGEAFDVERLRAALLDIREHLAPEFRAEADALLSQLGGP